MIFHNVCTVDCSASCHLLTEVDKKGRIVEILGDPQDPYSKGYICAKGFALKDLVYSSDRILYPQRQKNKGSGDWEQITWDEALEKIADKLVNIKRKYGTMLPVSFDKYLGTLGCLSMSVEAFFGSLGPHTEIAGNPCVATGTDAMILNYGDCLKPVPEEFLKARLILIWGSNPAWSGIQQMQLFYEAQEQGALIVVIDPLFTATAARSDIYYRINPGTDALLANSIAKILIENGWVDNEFIEKCTFGWPEFRAFLGDFDTLAASKITGIPINEVQALARLIGTTKPMSIVIGFGVQRGQKGGQQVRAIDSLAALTGNVGIPGGNVHYFHQAFEKLRLPASIRKNKGTIGNRVLGMDWFASASKLRPPLDFFWVAGRNPERSMVLKL